MITGATSTRLCTSYPEIGPSFFALSDQDPVVFSPPRYRPTFAGAKEAKLLLASQPNFPHSL
jgi:hypothetical protein